MLTGVVLAAEETGRFAAPAQAVAPQEIGASSGFLQIFGSLLLVIATILVVGWVAGKLKALPRRSSAVFRVVDEVALGNKGAGRTHRSRWRASGGRSG